MTHSQSPKVLIVEDEQLIAEFFQRVSEASGLEVLIVHSAAAALSYLESNYPELVLLDLRLSSGSGEEVLKALRSTKQFHRTYAERVRKVNCAA